MEYEYGTRDPFVAPEVHYICDKRFIGVSGRFLSLGSFDRKHFRTDHPYEFGNLKFNRRVKEFDSAITALEKRIGKTLVERDVKRGSK